jgi:hypothetical protein
MSTAPRFAGGLPNLREYADPRALTALVRDRVRRGPPGADLQPS